MVKNRLLKTKGKPLPKRGSMSQTETSVSIHMCLYYLLPVSAVFSEFHTHLL